MAENSNVKVENSGVKIKSIFKDLSKDQLKMELQRKDKDTTISCTLHSYDQDNQFFIKLQNNDHLEHINVNEEYVVGCGKDGATYNFVAKCIEDGPYVISLELPEEINITEHRNFKRFNTLALDNPYIEVDVGGEENVFIMCDLSQGGLSFLMAENLEGYLSMDQEVDLIKIGKQVFDTKIKSQVVHVSKVNQGDGTWIKVGLKFIDIPKLG